MASSTGWIGRSVRVAFAVFISLVPSSVSALSTDEFEAKDPAIALRSYQDELTRTPDGSAARNLSARVEWLKARSAGNFGPLGEYLRFRLVTIPSDASLTAFSSQADGFPPGLVRHEARALVADEWARLFHRTDLAIQEYRKLLVEPDLTNPERLLFARALSAGQVEAGDSAGAFETLRDNGLQYTDAYRHLELWVVEEWGSPVAFGAIALFLLLAVAVTLRGGWRNPIRLGTLAAIGVVLVVPCLLPLHYEPTMHRACLALAVGLTTILVASAVSGSALRARPQALLRNALVCSAVLACMGVGFLAASRSEVLEHLMRWYGLPWSKS